MCTPKSPKIQPTSQQAKQPDPAIIRNPYLDNATEFAQSRKGRSNLRIDLGSPVPARIPLPSSAKPTTPSPATPAKPGSTPAVNLATNPLLNLKIGRFAAERFGGPTY